MTAGSFGDGVVLFGGRGVARRFRGPTHSGNGGHVAGVLARALGDAATVTLNGVPVTATFADNQGDLVAKFQIDAVKATVSPPSAAVELVAHTYDGDEFVATDMVRVIQETGR